MQRVLEVLDAFLLEPRNLRLDALRRLVELVLRVQGAPLRLYTRSVSLRQWRKLLHLPRKPGSANLGVPRDRSERGPARGCARAYFSRGAIPSQLRATSDTCGCAS